MEEMITAGEIAALWGIPDNQVTRYCRERRIEGARKEKGVWLIPADASKPMDQRRKRNGAESTPLSPRKPLPIGVTSYRDACRNYYYVDKTLMIRDLLDERPKVSLFTRPRRFGKTMAMDMLKTFFEISDEDTAAYFRNKQIWLCGNQYRKHQGKYPAIFLSFKDVKCDTWKETYRLITQIIDLEYIRHSELAQSEKVTIKSCYQRIVSGQADESEYAFSLKHLSQMLREHYSVAPIIIIDEYDTPIQQGHTKDFYEKIVEFMRNLFSGGLKDNDLNLSFGFLTGILRVAKESIFSGLNNLNINSILDERYSPYFGFTTEEVKAMAEYYGASDRYEEICRWYDGYRFGQTDIFNPWSVLNYFNKNCKVDRYWENTGNHAIIGELLEEANEEMLENLKHLLQGKAITTYIDTNVIYPEIRNNPASVYSFLLAAGYLKILEARVSDSGDLMGKVSLPNREIALVYKKEIINQVHHTVGRSISLGIQEALYTKNVAKLQKCLQDFLEESVSCYDIPNENAYHMLLLGLCAIMSDRYYLTSNRESGKGRFDIQLMPKDVCEPGILIELKADKNCSEAERKALAQAALQQIADRKYDTQMLAHGVTQILKFGVAFSGKCVEVVTSPE